MLDHARDLLLSHWQRGHSLELEINHRRTVVVTTEMARQFGLGRLEQMSNTVLRSTLVIIGPVLADDPFFRALQPRLRVSVRGIDAHCGRGHAIDRSCRLRTCPARSDCNCLRDIPRVYEMALWARSSSAHAGCAGEGQYARMT